MKRCNPDIDPELAGEIAVRMTARMIEASVSIGDAEPEADPSMAVYALMLTMSYWLCVVDPVMKVKLTRQIERDWPEVLSARLEGENAVN
jgi:hypothetical protein